MLTGTISDFDPQGLFGVIYADNGRFYLFNLRDTPRALHDRFTVGRRLEFMELSGCRVPRAGHLLPLGLAGAENSGSPAARAH